jgi:hypothetical protein
LPCCDVIDAAAGQRRDGVRVQSRADRAVFFACDAVGCQKKANNPAGRYVLKHQPACRSARSLHTAPSRSRRRTGLAARPAAPRQCCPSRTRALFVRLTRCPCSPGGTVRHACLVVPWIVDHNMRPRTALVGLAPPRPSPAPGDSCPSRRTRSPGLPQRNPGNSRRRPGGPPSQRARHDYRKHRPFRAVFRAHRAHPAAYDRPVRSGAGMGRGEGTVDVAGAAVRLAQGARLRSVLDVNDPGDWLALDAGVRHVAWYHSPIRGTSMNPGSRWRSATATGTSARWRCAGRPGVPACCR